MGYFFCNLLLLVSSIAASLSEDVRLLDLPPEEAQQHIESKDQTLNYAPKIESNVPALRYIGNDQQNVIEDVYLANQYHGQDGLGGYLYGYSVPDIAKTEKKKAHGELRGAYQYKNDEGKEIKVQYWDDGMGFHQEDNVREVAPQQVDDAPDVKQAKEAFFKRWHEEAERNSKAPDADGSSPHQYGATSTQGVPGPTWPERQENQFSKSSSIGQFNQAQNPSSSQLPHQNLGHQQTNFQSNPSNKVQPEQGGNYQDNSGQSTAGYQDYPRQLGQHQASQSGQVDYYKPGQGSPSSDENKLKSSGGRINSGGTLTQYEISNSAHSTQHNLGYGFQPDVPGKFQASGFSTDTGVQQSQVPQSIYGNTQENTQKSSLSSFPNRPDSHQVPSQGQANTQRSSALRGGTHPSGNQQILSDVTRKSTQVENNSPYGNFGDGSGLPQPARQLEYSGNQGDQSFQGQYSARGGSTVNQQHGSTVPCPCDNEGQHQTQSQHQNPGEYSNKGQYQNQANPGRDYSGQASENTRSYDQGEWKYEPNGEEQGPPRGFFYNVDYPVGIIVQKQGSAKNQGKRDALDNIYQENKDEFERLLRAGGGDNTRSYQVHA